MRKRALIITDSLGAPRYEPETIAYEQTWVHGVKEYLEKNGYDIFIITHNGLHSRDLMDLARTKLNLYSARLIILQFGIVDCAPRVLKDREIRAFRVLGLGKAAHYLAKKFHAPLSNLRKMSLFSPVVFEDHVEKTYGILKSEGVRILQVPIAPANTAYIKTSPRIEQNILAYNKILEKYADIYVADFFNLAKNEAESIFMSDHHHLNHNGHSMLRGVVLKSIDQIL